MKEIYKKSKLKGKETKLREVEQNKQRGKKKRRDKNI